MAPSRKYSSYKYGAVGSRPTVFHGNAHHTSGGLTQSDLKRNTTTGKIVSKKASASAKRCNNLVKAGWVTQKGVFGAIKCDEVAKKCKSPRRKSTKKGMVRKTARRAYMKSPLRKSPRRKSPRRRRKSPRRKSPKHKSPKRHRRHLHVTRTSLKRKRRSPVLHKHS